MSKKIKNTTTLPKVYYGLHMVAGTAEYRSENEEPYRIFIGEATIKNMDSTFTGRPVYVEHVDEVNLSEIKEADGFVVESFYNKVDGKHWAKFIIITDAGHNAIRQGWKLSNAYIPTSFSGGGLCHGVEFLKEVTNGEYEHLAIVPNPRYEESIILTPEQFKAYNDGKELDLKRVANSKGDKKMKFQMFKKAKVENAADLSEMSVTLPESKTEKTVSECIEIADKFLNMHGYANGEHMVKVGEEEMSVNQMLENYSQMKSSMDEQKQKNADEEEKKKKENAEMSDEEKAKKNADEEEEKKKKENEEAEKKKENEAYLAFKNAHHTKAKDEPVLNLDKLAVGKAKYGSN